MRFWGFGARRVRFRKQSAGNRVGDEVLGLGTSGFGYAVWGAAWVLGIGYGAQGWQSR
jgi:hypothetical protein